MNDSQHKPQNFLHRSAGVDQLDPALSRPKYVGRPVERLEDPRLLTGVGKFTADMTFPKMLHAVFVRSSHAHAQILQIDFAEALNLSGVIAVYTAKDFADFKPISAQSKMQNYQETLQPILAGNKVRYVGEPIAVIVAKNRYIAEDASELIKIDYDPLPPLVDPESAADRESPRLHEHLKSNVIVERVFKTGDPETIKAQAAKCVSGRFRFRRKSPVAMEPRACLAEFNEGQDILTLFCTTQIPGMLRDKISSQLNLTGHQIRVVAPDVGGGFGGKGSLYVEDIAVAAIARNLKRPIKWVADRLEDLLSTSQAFDEVIEAELAFDNKGNFLALMATVLGDVGAYSIYPWTAALEPVQVASFLPGPYKIPHYQGKISAISTCKPPTGPYRGVGRPAAVLVLERLVDKAAATLCMDPKKIREQNFVKSEDAPFRIGSGIIWDHSSFSECLSTACEAAGYETLCNKRDEARKDGKLFGVGIASYAELTGIGSQISVAPGMPINTGTETANIQIDATGAITATFAIASHGQGLETTLAQIVADEMGVSPSDVRVRHGDTDDTPHGTGTYASRSAVIGGGAAINASKALMAKVRTVAASIFDVKEEDIVVESGKIFVPNTNNIITYPDLADAVYANMRALPQEKRIPLISSETYDPYVGTTTGSTHVAFVEVDPETYSIKVLNYLVAEDCGKLINPLIVDGQVHGGVAQGIGAALFEEMIYDGQGQLLTASLASYLLPTAAEIPCIDVCHLETKIPKNPGGFRGMGEGGTIGAPGAIANAVSDALSPLGVEVSELPITSDRIFKMLENAENRLALEKENGSRP